MTTPTTSDTPPWLAARLEERQRRRQRDAEERAAAKAARFYAKRLHHIERLRRGRAGDKEGRS